MPPTDAGPSRNDDAGDDDKLDHQTPQDREESFSPTTVEKTLVDLLVKSGNDLVKEKESMLAARRATQEAEVANFARDRAVKKAIDEAAADAIVLNTNTTASGSPAHVAPEDTPTSDTSALVESSSDDEPLSTRLAKPSPLHTSTQPNDGQKQDEKGKAPLSANRQVDGAHGQPIYIASSSDDEPLALQAAKRAASRNTAPSQAQKHSGARRGRAYTSRKRRASSPAAAATTSTLSKKSRHLPAEPTSPHRYVLESASEPDEPTWAQLKPSKLKRPFAGHINYLAHEVPVRGEHGFMLLHARPRFACGQRFAATADGQHVDQRAMLTLYFMDNASLRVQTHRYPDPDRIAWWDRLDVRRCNYWLNTFLWDRGVQKKRLDLTPYHPDELAWLRRLFERDPQFRLGDLADVFNKRFEGRLLEGQRLPRPKRTNGALVNEIYRKGLKKGVEEEQPEDEDAENEEEADEGEFMQEKE